MEGTNLGKDLMLAANQTILTVIMKFSAITTLAAALLASTAAAGNVTEGCWEISVEHDATYCIEGPICSGDGLEPAGSLCPVKGDASIADCHSYLTSYTEDAGCVLPVDTTCEVIKTGAWGCVLSSGSSSGSGEGETIGSGSSAGNESVSFSVPVAASSSAGLSAGVIGAIAAAAAAVAAIAGVAIYKQAQKGAEERAREQSQTMVDVVTP
ncbi:hypothetical protein BBJ28_00012047 [Nothophytophthora sp. Chile5]|nr:hypothetical protein BBJ28_00012047 [Nothophytophthora sp. Chile5]